MVRNNKGFTLIELLIVVVIIGLLTSIAIPKFGSTKDKAYIAALKSDLKNFVLAEEAYFADYGRYGTSTNVVAAGLFGSTSNVNLVSSDGNGRGFSAEATHENLGTGALETCGVYVGDATPPDASLTAEGAVGCY